MPPNDPKDEASVEVERVLMDALARARQTVTEDPVSAGEVFADLACDWAFVVRLGPDGAWEREWITGGVPSSPDVELENLDPAPWDSYIVPDDRRIVLDQFVRALERGRDRVEYRLDLPGIGVRFVESTMRAVRDPEEEGAFRLYGAMSDITGGRWSPSKGRISEVMLRAATERVPRAWKRFTRKRCLAS